MKTQCYTTLALKHKALEEGQRPNWKLRHPSETIEPDKGTNQPISGGLVIRVLPSKPFFCIINTVVKCVQSKERLSLAAISQKNEAHIAVLFT